MKIGTFSLWVKPTDGYMPYRVDVTVGKYLINDLPAALSCLMTNNRPEAAQEPTTALWVVKHDGYKGQTQDDLVASLKVQLKLKCVWEPTLHNEFMTFSSRSTE